MARIERVAFCGLGIMGGPMAANLARAGFELSVWTRTVEKAERFAAEHGARAAATPAEAAEDAEATNTMGAVNAAALAESVVAVQQAGVNPEAFLEVAAGSAGGSTVLTLKGQP